MENHVHLHLKVWLGMLLALTILSAAICYAYETPVDIDIREYTFEEESNRLIIKIRGFAGYKKNGTTVGFNDKDKLWAGFDLHDPSSTPYSQDRNPSLKTSTGEFTFKIVGVETKGYVEMKFDTEIVRMRLIGTAGKNQPKIMVHAPAGGKVLVSGLVKAKATGAVENLTTSKKVSVTATSKGHFWALIAGKSGDKMKVTLGGWIVEIKVPSRSKAVPFGVWTLNPSRTLRTLAALAVWPKMFYGGVGNEILKFINPSDDVKVNIGEWVFLAAPFDPKTILRAYRY